MKKKIISIFVCMLMFVTVSTVTGTMNADFNDVNKINDVPNQNSMDQWDLQFSIDVETPTGEQSLVGAEFDGTHFLVTEWGWTGATQPLIVSKLDRDGNLVSQWNPTWLSGGSGGLRDLAYDGEYFYGGNTGNTIYCFDVDGNLITSWSSPSQVRSIAYDEDNDAFWVNNWDSTLMLVDRSGDTLYTIASPPSLYGSAWEKTCDGTPTLWIFTGTATGGPCQIEKFVDLYTGGTNLGNQHQVSDDFDPTAIAGGLFFTELYIDGYATLGGIIQMSPDYLFGYEMCQTNFPPETPGTPDGPTEGYVEEQYDFSASTEDPDGDMIQYGWDFDGDFVVDEWTDFVNSGTTSTVTVSYDDAGTYKIRVKAVDINQLESGWSAPHSIEISELPELKVINVDGTFFKVTPKITNNGPVSADGVTWKISIEGGILITGRTFTDTIDMPPGEDLTIESGLILGIGNVKIKVTLDHPLDTATKTRTAFVLGFLIF